jgi:hypothetical protein
MKNVTNMGIVDLSNNELYNTTGGSEFSEKVYYGLAFIAAPFALGVTYVGGWSYRGL